MSLSSIARRLVSGNKARFKDDKLGVDLDLAYLTDRIIMMGYPASGAEAFYRNRARDVRKFLQARHGDKYWVFNFCPLNENSYPASLFDGRVSRYPFPDHHAPPLAILALATREMHSWLQGDPDRVVVLHCKAGKGRTGTLACAYLLSTKESPTPPKLKRSYTDKQWAKLEAERLVRAVDSEESGSEASDHEGTGSSGTDKAVEVAREKMEQLGMTSDKANISQNTLDAVLDLHTNRRMRPPEKDEVKRKRGVSIASQRRFLYYWSIIVLSPNDAPKDFWPIHPIPSDDRPKIYLNEIRVRMKDTSGMTKTALKVLNSALEVAGRNGDKEKGDGDMWVSLARYEDSFVDVLEDWERRTRSHQDVSRKRESGSGSESPAETEEGWDIGKHGIFADGKWDSGKMVKSFSRVGEYGDDAEETEKAEDGLNRIHLLRPLPPNTWIHVDRPAQRMHVDGEVDNASTTDLQGASEAELEEDGILLEANREVRAKLYMGEVPFGWFWFIPAFHMPELKPGVSHRLTFTRKEVDFPIGIGSWLVDVSLKLTWAGEEAADVAPRAFRKEQSGDRVGEIVANAAMGGDVSAVPEAVQAERQK